MATKIKSIFNRKAAIAFCRRTAQKLAKRHYQPINTNSSQQSCACRRGNNSSAELAFLEATVTIAGDD
jgi:hypothetical protein